MRNGFHDFQFHQAVGKQSQSPARLSFWARATAERYQVRFLFSIQQLLPRRANMLLPFQRGAETLLHKTLANAFDGAHVDLASRADLCIGERGSMRPCIRFQQHACMSQLARRSQANAARRWADQVRATVRNILGLRPRPRQHA